MRKISRPPSGAQQVKKRAQTSVQVSWQLNFSGGKPTMAMTEADVLREEVRNAYSTPARRPEEKHAFPVGRAFAESVSCAAELLDRLPAIASDGFAGVSNASLYADIPLGATVLDLGCGAGPDTLIAARRAASLGKVIALDYGAAMLDRARQAVAESGERNVEVREADAEHLLLADGQIDVAIVNGILNLNPSRGTIFRELARVISPGGTVFAAELIISSPLPPESRTSEADWFA